MQTIINRNIIKHYFLNPALYIVAGTVIWMVLHMLTTPLDWIALLIMSLAIPAWYIKLWLPFTNNYREELPLEEDFIP